LPHRITLLDGNTGTAKTDVLARLAVRGEQVLDLESLAGHRGSMLGGRGDQPSQRMFEGRLATALARLDPDRPVVIEAESSRIGRRALPPALWGAMCAAPRIDMSAPLAARAEYLVRTYADVIADQDRLRELFAPLRAHRGHAVVDGWLAMLAAGDHAGLARALMDQHYDPAYARSRAMHGADVLGRVEMSGLADADLDRAADRVVALISGR
jgi:tRNA 2-selenouridine synthase